jgi:hypothetical protein
MTIDDTIYDVRPWVRPGALRTAALVMGSAGAAAIHFAMIPAHADESTALAVGFAVVAWLQTAFAVAVLVRPTRALLVAGAVLNLSALSIWAWSRLFGLPFGIGGGGVEAVDAVDALCALLEIAVIAAAVWPSGKAAPGRSRPAVLVAGALASVLVVAATSAVLAAPASHDHGNAEAHDEAHVDAASAAAENTHDHDASTSRDQDADISRSGDSAGHHHEACTAPVTPRQQAAADELVTDTRATLGQYATFDAAVADGFVNITPEGQLVVHYARPQWLVDSKVLDASAPESLVYAFPQRTRPVLLGAMYLMETATNPPTPGGCLTQWHDHQNLCIAPGEGMVAVVGPDGSCPPGSSNESTQSMMHVWRYDTSAGPFAELRAIDPAELRAAVVADLRS